MATTLPSEFFTVQSMLTLTGATGAIEQVESAHGNEYGMQQVFNFNPRWLALLLAEAISLYGTYLNATRPSDYFVAIVNGFLIYCTSAGATQITGVPTTSGTRMGPKGDGPPPHRSFRSTWF